MRRMIQCSTFIVFPLLVGLCLCAKPLIVLLYSDKWMSAIPYLKVACFAFAMLPFNTINTAAISAMGRSDVFLLLDCIKKSVGILVIFVSLHYGVMAFMLAMSFVQSPFAILVNTFANGRLLGYNLKMQLRDVLPSAIFTGIMALAVICVQFFLKPIFAMISFVPVALAAELLASFMVGVTVYFALSLYFKPQPFLEYVNAMLPMLRTRMPVLTRIAERVGQ